MNKTKNSVEASGASATETTPATQGMFANVPVTVGAASGTGKFHTVWVKKDLSGTPSRMAEKADDKVVNKGEVVKCPETGQDVYLIRVHRGKRVWYGKQLLSDTPAAVVAEVASEE
jgi:hypothetical protein